MKRHQCRHCGLVLDTYAALKRHVAKHATATVNEHTYAAAQPIEVPPSDQAKRTKYSCKCDATFERWDDLQQHVRSVCRLSSSSSSSSNRKQTTVYTCAKCGKTFTRLNDLTRHAGKACTDDGVTKPPSPKRSIREATTPCICVCIGNEWMVIHSLPMQTPSTHLLDSPSPTTCRRNC